MFFHVILNFYLIQYNLCIFQVFDGYEECQQQVYAPDELQREQEEFRVPVQWGRGSVSRTQMVRSRSLS